jgi:hypothetical protein
MHFIPSDVAFLLESVVSRFLLAQYVHLLLISVETASPYPGATRLQLRKQALHLTFPSEYNVLS